MVTSFLYVVLTNKQATYLLVSKQHTMCTGLHDFVDGIRMLLLMPACHVLSAG